VVLREVIENVSTLLRQSQQTASRLRDLPNENTSTSTPQQRCQNPRHGLQDPIDGHLDCLKAEDDRHLVSNPSFGNTVIPANLQRRMTPCSQANQVKINIVAA
jgi:hypothetical protein